VFIPRYDRPFTLFYIDPPYWGHEADYGRDLFARGWLAEVLHSIKGRFILSINEHPEVRRLFAWAEIEVVRSAYTFNYRVRRPAQELLITGGP